MSTVPIDISYRNPQLPTQFRRDSFAHSQGMGGISWGGMSVGSWLREEVMLNNMNAPIQKPLSMSPENSTTYFPALEADFCRDYSCCGKLLPTLHDLLRHYEESHVSPSPPMEAPVMRRMQNLEMVSTNEVFLGGQAGGNLRSSIVDPSAAMAPPEAVTGTMDMPAGSVPKDDDEEMCIDDPARHLYVIERSDNKPYKCPVVGCDKTYKNQNGLKYHRLHGHQNQTLHLNDDGTYSIIDPLSNTPYPDGMGMEKDKPYRCEICGKRYKNLNGLKYHRAHSTH